MIGGAALEWTAAVAGLVLALAAELLDAAGEAEG